MAIFPNQPDDPTKKPYQAVMDALMRGVKPWEQALGPAGPTGAAQAAPAPSMPAMAPQRPPAPPTGAVAAPAPAQMASTAPPPVRVAESGMTQTDAMPDPSKAQEKVDSEYAKDYIAWVSGDAGNAVHNLSRLIEARNALNAAVAKKGPSMTGPITGRTPEFLQPYLTPEAQDTRETIESVVQQNLRIILGAAFTENEARRLIERAYNPALDEKKNLKRLNGMILALQSGIENRSKMAEYYQANGTLQGFQGHIPSVEDFDAVLDALDKTSGTAKDMKNEPMNINGVTIKRVR